MNTIFLEGKSYKYDIKRKNISSLRLRVISKDSFQISCPLITPNFIIEKFIKKNISWIINRCQKMTTKKAILKLKEIKILDKIYKINIIKTQRDSVIIDDIEQIIYANLSTLKEGHAKKILSEKLKPFSLKLIKKELLFLSKEHSFTYNKVSVRNQKSRYGSCSGRGNLSFNWQIIFFPYPQFRHILLHELTHLEIKNHSIKFWRKLAIYDLDSNKNNLWLKKEGQKYFIFK